MKLLIYSHFFAPSVGGVETLVLSLARGLAGLPFPVVRQPNLIHLWDLIRASEVVHVAGPALAPLSLAFLARRPVVIEHHGYQSICPNGLLIHRPDNRVCPGHFLARNYGECLRCLKQDSSSWRSLATLLLEFPRNFLVRHVAANLAISNHSLKGCRLPHSTVLYHGIESEIESGPEFDSLSPAAGKICFAYVGRLVSEKGIDDLLQASRLLREEGHAFVVRLIGDGPERSRLEAIIARDHLEPYVQLTGFLTGTAFAESLRDVRVVVMPSVWEETAGLAALEQMMRGRLVIASDIGGLGEIVGDTCLKFSPGDAVALADAMRRVILQPALIDPLGKLARERGQKLFLRERMITEHASVYRNALIPRKKPAELRS
jgi:glycosyltransferase involved in cell wall biosynthesis